MCCTRLNCLNSPHTNHVLIRIFSFQLSLLSLFTIQPVYVRYDCICESEIIIVLTLKLPRPAAGVEGSLDSYYSLKPLWSGMGEVVPARTSPPLHPHPLPLFCDNPVYKCISASIVIASTLRVKDYANVEECYTAD